MEDTRPDQYQYYLKLLNHLGSDDLFFNGDFVWPRQFEIHLPGDHKRHCNLNCKHCQGKYFIKSLGHWEMEALELLDGLRGAIPFHIYGGAYSEPLLNPYLMTFIAMTKKYGGHFGIHTNGTKLAVLDKNQGWLKELNRLSTDKNDYLSISLDAGTSYSWAKSKNSYFHTFLKIIGAIGKACDISSGNSHSIRICYLITKETSSLHDLENAVGIAKSFGVDSLRFSIPYAPYNQKFDRVREYKRDTEIPCNDKYYEMLKPYLSKSKNEVPYIFYTGPESTDIDRYTFNKCIYGYYQITYGADGYVYKCSSSATPTAKQCRLGKITSDVEEFKSMIVKNYNPNWDSQKMCFNKGIRCNRMALEINSEYESRNN